jgi:hypothetical protein
VAGAPRNSIQALWHADGFCSGGGVSCCKRRTDEEIRSSRDGVASQVGKELYRKFVEGYTRKGPRGNATRPLGHVPRAHKDRHRPPLLSGHLPVHATGRLYPHVRADDRPSRHPLPAEHYGQVRNVLAHEHLVYSGPVDNVNHRCRRLRYRSLRFEHTTLDQPRLRVVGVVDYPSSEVPYTGITGYKHLTGRGIHAQEARVSSRPTKAIRTTRSTRPRAPRCTGAMKRSPSTRLEAAFTGRLGTCCYCNLGQAVAQTSYSLRTSRWAAACLSVALDTARGGRMPRRNRPPYQSVRRSCWREDASGSRRADGAFHRPKTSRSAKRKPQT